LKVRRRQTAPAWGLFGMFYPESDSLFAALRVVRPQVAAHSRRVSVYAVRLANQYGLGGDAIRTIRDGALLHDVGKLLVSARILEKPGRLREREWVTLKSHPDLGVELAEQCGLAPDVCEVILRHHERYDGLGYPDRLTGAQVPWAVRIIGVMDSFDALTSPRKYRRSLQPPAARALIAREAGTRFCPWVVAGLLSLPLSLLDPPDPDTSLDYLADGVPWPASLDATTAWPAQNSL
jgi:putative nucleotidyltransferase with HDIG domain